MGVGERAEVGREDRQAQVRDRLPPGHPELHAGGAAVRSERRPVDGTLRGRGELGRYDEGAQESGEHPSHVVIVRRSTVKPSLARPDT